MKLDDAITYLMDMRNEYGNLELLITFEDYHGVLHKVEDFVLRERQYSYPAGYYGIKESELIEADWG